MRLSLKKNSQGYFEKNIIFTHPAFLTAPVQLNEAAAVPVCLPRYGEF